MGEMSDSTDASLLAAWCADGSDEAFAALARRYAGLLYHAARRRTGRDDLAAEAAQNSLLILARKAPRLGHLPNLSGWLHRTACYEAAKLLRREQRHHARMKHLPLPDDGDASWKDAAPLLDHAIDELSEKDRQVIFLRYFDGLSFEQIARQFGGEPAAWRQRGSRAVERLRCSLTKRGVAVSSAALSSGLGVSLGQTAPAAFLTNLPHPATAAAALSWKTLTLHSIHLMKMKPAAVIAATLLLSLIPLGMQANALSETRRRVSLLESSIASSEDPRIRKAAAKLRTVSRVNLPAFADALLAAKQGDLLKEFSTERKLDAMDADELERLLLESTEIELGPEQRGALVHALLRRFCRIAEKSNIPGERVVSLVMKLTPSMQSGYGTLWNLADNPLDRWVDENPSAAVAWYREHGRLTSQADAAIFSAKVFDGLHRRNPDEAIAFFDSLSDSEKQGVIGGGGGWKEVPLMLELASGIGNEHLRSTALGQVFARTYGLPPSDVRTWIDHLQPSANDAAQWLGNAAGRTSGEVTVDEVANRMDWLRETAAGLDPSQAIGVFLADIATTSHDAVTRTLDREWKREPDERMLAAYISRCMFNESLILDAIPRSRLITDADLRDSALRMMLLSSRGEEDARKLAHKGGLTESEIDRILPHKP